MGRRYLVSLLLLLFLLAPAEAEGSLHWPAGLICLSAVGPSGARRCRYCSLIRAATDRHQAAPAPANGRMDENNGRVAAREIYYVIDWSSGGSLLCRAGLAPSPVAVHLWRLAGHSVAAARPRAREALAAAARNKAHTIGSPEPPDRMYVRHDDDDDDGSCCRSERSPRLIIILISGRSFWSDGRHPSRLPPPESSREQRSPATCRAAHVRRGGGGSSGFSRRMLARGRSLKSGGDDDDDDGGSGLARATRGWKWKWESREIWRPRLLNMAGSTSVCVSACQLGRAEQ